eukprot:242137_1
MTDPTFNPRFYSSHEAALVKRCQNSFGCFNCGKKAKLQCSRCKIAMYCDSDCQLKNWKRGTSGMNSHKSICKQIRKFRARKPGPIARLLLDPIHYLKYDDDLVAEMRVYGDLFLQEAERSLKKRRIDLIVLCMEDEGFVRLIVSAKLMAKRGENFDGIDYIDNVSDPFGCSYIQCILFEPLDHGPDACEKVEPPNGTSGMICNDAKEMAIAHIVDLLERMQTHQIQPGALSYGRGLMWLQEDEAAQEMFTSASPGIILIPDQIYVKKDLWNSIL